MLRHAIAACLLGVILSACGIGTPASGKATGTVTGHVQIRACGGAYRPEETACPTQRAAGVGLISRLATAPGNASETTVKTDPNGAYRVNLPPGSYTVIAAGRGGLDGPRQVVVSAGRTVTADFVYTIQLL